MHSSIEIQFILIHVLRPCRVWKSQVGAAPERAQSLGRLSSQHILVVNGSYGSTNERSHPKDPL